jgi:molybdopterin-dependent oxidoreductase alpha subunit
MTQVNVIRRSCIITTLAPPKDMMKDQDAPHITPYTKPAAGWDALKHVAISLRQERVAPGNLKALLAQNQPDGFDCPGCAWPDRDHASTFAFCENGAKAVAAEATSRRAGPELFAGHTVAQLLQQSDYALEQHGRLTEPMVYDAASDRYVPIAWEDAYALVGRHLRALPDPDQAAFYTSGRASNEAAFLYQLMARLYGTNNFPDCSNMCHEATSRGLPATVGIGKGTVTLADFELADTILIFGQNPATNHPRMLGELRECARRGGSIVSINPLRERGLQRFMDPQSALEMATLGSTRLAGLFVQPTLGGDFALIKAVAKRVVEHDDAAQAAGAPAVIDHAFILEHCSGFDAFCDDLRAESWELLERESGVARAQIEALTDIFVQGQRIIATWGMGLTQHKHSVAAIRMLSNLMLLRGQIGKPGAGLCPVRGHSNVQGDRTVGIEEKPTSAFLDRLGQVYGFAPPRAHGHDVVATIEAMQRGDVKVFIALGGNFAAATPDTPLTFAALRQCALTVQVATKLNRSHLVIGKEALLLPTLGRTEIDLQGGVAQGVTVEDSMSMVHISYGRNAPASAQLRSEVAIVAGMAEATVGSTQVDWRAYAADYARIRDEIEKVFDDFYDYNARVAQPGGFHLTVASRERVWKTASGKASFLVAPLDLDTPLHRARKRHGARLMVLMSTRSHDQYNTTIYGMDDRYRGVYGTRKVVFANAADIAMLGFADGDLVDLIGAWDDGVARRADAFRLVAYDIPRGCLGAYYPETNALVPLASTADGAGTPTSKSVPVLLERSGTYKVMPGV